MPPQETDERPLFAPQTRLETAYLEEYLGRAGYSLAGLKDLPEADAKHLMTAASLYASAKLSEVETRSHFVEEMHGMVPLR